MPKPAAKKRPPLRVIFHLMLFSLALVGYALSYLNLPSSPHSPANALQDERLFFMATAVSVAFALIFNGWRAARRGRQRGAAGR
jgi:hypothetical protein